MRAISADLLTKQNAASNTPYIYLLFTSADGNTTYDYSSDLRGRRILFIDHYEEPYSSTATIILNNYDRSIPQLKGYWVEIGYGYYTGNNIALPDGDNNGNEFSKTPRLWVKHQQDISAQGKMVTLLELEGMWEKAKEMPVRVGSPPYYQDESGDYIGITPYDAMSAVLAEIGMTLNTLVEDDGIADTYTIPIFLINLELFESAQGLLHRLVSTTKSYLKPLTSLQFEIKFPQDADSIDISYYSSQAPYFYEYTERHNILIPNHIIVFCNEADDWDITGEASDSAEIALYDDIIRLTTAAEITTQADATNRANALLSRALMESTAGRLYAPHDCQVELYDKIKAYDTRGL